MTDRPPRPSWRYRMFERLFDFRWPVLILTGVATAVLIWAGATLKWREDVMDLLPKQDPLIAQTLSILNDFGQMNMMLVEVGPPAGAPTGTPPVSPDELIAAADRIEQQMQGSGLFRSITYRMDVADFTTALDVLRGHRASLFTAADETSLTERLKPESIRTILAGWKRQLTETPAPFVAQAFARDPLGMDELLLKKINAAQSFDGPVRVEKGRLFSRDLAHILIMADPLHPSTDSFHSQALVDYMDAAARETEKASAGRIEAAYLCGHRFGLENATRIKSDVRLTLLISLIAIALVSLCVYRRPLWVGLTFLPTFFGGAFALGLLRWLVPDISAIAIGCGSMLLGIAVDLGIHLLYQIDQLGEDRPRKEQILEILDLLFWPLILCSATTIVAFFSLEWSNLPGYQSLGHFAALGFTGATIFAVFILPLLVPLRPRRPARAPLVPAARLFPPFYGWSGRHRRAILVFLVISLLACLPGLGRIQFEGDYQKMNAVSPRVRSDMDKITGLFGAAMPSTALVVRGGDMNSSLAANDNLYASLKGLQQTGEVESVQSIAPLLPSPEAQAAAQRRWSGFWSPARIARLKTDLDQAAAGLRLRPGVFAPFLASLAAPARFIGPEDLQSGLMKQLIALHVAPAASGSPVLTNLTIPAGGDAGVVFETLRRWGHNFVPFQSSRLLEHVVGLIYHQMIRVSILSILLVVLILVVYYRAWGSLALILLPLLVGLFWTFGIMGWLGMRINLMNSLIVVFVFGVVVDYSLLLVTALRRAARADDPFLVRTSVSITVSAVTTQIGLGVLIVARHPALHSIGLTSLLGIGSGLLAVFTIIPLARRLEAPAREDRSPEK